MLKSIFRCNISGFLNHKNQLKTIGTSSNLTEIITCDRKIRNGNLIEKVPFDIPKEEQKSVLEKCDEDISHIAPYLKPTFNLAAYINKSETLKNFLKIGVNLYKLEKMNDVPAFLIGLDFEKDVKEHIMFLYALGMQTDEIGTFITSNPFVFKESLDDLRTRINYLKYKKFDNEMILRIISLNPLWLQFSTQSIDSKLGFFQKHFSLTGDEVRTLCLRKPKIITYNLHHIKLSCFTIKEEMGFNSEETKSILLQKPGVFMKRHDNVIQTFEYLHRKMNIPHEDIVKWPEVLTCRVHRLKERYLFLEKLNKVQFDPKKPNYISLVTLVSGNDSYFATEVAKSSIQTYNEFLKTL